MRTIETTVYKFEELSDKAKETARDWYREVSCGDEWWDFAYEDFGEICKILGVELATKLVPLHGGGTRAEPQVYFTGFSSQGDGACFCGRYSYAKGSKKKIRDYAPQDTELHRIADGLQDLQRRHGYRIAARITTSGQYSHSGTMQFELSDKQTGCDSWGIETDKELAQLLRDLADWLYDTLEKEHDWRNSDEQVDETIIANEYEFTESGKNV